VGILDAIIEMASCFLTTFVMVHGAPKIVALSSDLHEHFV
jgi:hypothetical protein